MSGPWEGLARRLDLGAAERVKEAAMDKTSKGVETTGAGRKVKVHAPFGGYNRAARRKLLRDARAGKLAVPKVGPRPTKMGQWLDPSTGAGLESSEPEGEGT